MAFMQPVAEFMTMYHVETNCGTELVPAELCELVDLEAEPDQGAWDELLSYCEGSNIAGVERKEGWYGRLSASGFLDCTSWDGPYESAAEAISAVCDTYDVDEYGNDRDCAEGDET